MNPRVRFDDEADAEYRLAGRWYEARREHLGIEFFDAVDTTIDQIVAMHGRLDILVNVACGSMHRHPVEDFPLEHWRAVIELNLTSTFLCCRAALRMMKNQKSGAIVNIASAAIDAPSPGLVAYATSKAAVAQLTRTLAAELGAAGVRVNGIAPGFIDIQSHSWDALLWRDGRVLGKVTQGVTTEILGEGTSAGPFTGKLAARPVSVQNRAAQIHTLGEYLEAIERSEVAVNVASYVGVGNIWQCVMGYSFDRPGPAELQKMKELLAAAMRDGAFGLSSQVMTPPGSLARTDVATCRLETPLAEVRTLLDGSDWDSCFVVNEERIVLGRVYRSDVSDATHLPAFHQIEGLAIDTDLSFADLRGTLAELARNLLGPETSIRMRPHHFRFTEPSCEVDAWHDGRWIELLGAGMVHPNVLRAVGYDPEAVQGFAFGLGPERVAMLRHGIGDLRLFIENDLRFVTDH